MKLTMLPNKILRQISHDVIFPLSPKTLKIIATMKEHIYSSLDEENHLRPGVGLAANQIGLNLNMFFIHIPLAEGKYMTDFIINPVLKAESASFAALKDGEGCLSVLDDEENTEGYVLRKWKIVVEAFSLAENKKKTYKLTGYPAIVFQHELDHLQGKLFFDRINHKTPWKKADSLILI